MQDRFARGILIAALLGCGCGNSGTTDSRAKTEAPPAEEAVAAVETPPPEQGREPPYEPSEPEPAGGPATATTSPVSLTDAAWEQVQEQIAAHKGKVVVVDLWATYCVPCRASFPGLVALSKQDPENIVCISVSLDDPGDPKKRADALQFLQEQRAEFTNLLCTTDSDKLYDEILQIGGIPAVYVYGRDGAQAKVFTGPTPEGEDHTYEQHIAPFVTELAAAK
jgi:thiol-disulfide isomerase/thioredoxin